MKDEVWKSVVGFEGIYEVSNLSRVRSVDRFVEYRSDAKKSGGKFIRGVLMSPRKNRSGHWNVSLARNNKYVKRCIHRIMAEAHIPNPNDLPCALHIDDDKNNNHISNIYWGTHAQNGKDMIENGTVSRGSKHKPSKLTEEQVLDIRKCLEKGDSGEVIAERYNVEKSTISCIKNRKTWKHI